MRKIILSTLILSFSLAGPAFAGAGEGLVQVKQCMSCHDVSADKVGPSFQNIARRFSGLKNAKTMLAHVVISGSEKGAVYHWGPEKMPADTVRVPVSMAEAEEMVDYILSLK